MSSVVMIYGRPYSRNIVLIRSPLHNCVRIKGLINFIIPQRINHFDNKRRSYHPGLFRFIVNQFFMISLWLMIVLGIVVVGRENLGSKPFWKYFNVPKFLCIVYYERLSFKNCNTSMWNCCKSMAFGRKYIKILFF